MEAAAKKKPKPSSRIRPPHTRSKVFHRNLQYILGAKKKTQESFAEDMGVSQPYISTLLSGRNEPRLGTLFLIADNLGVPPEVLIATELDVVKRFMDKVQNVAQGDPIRLALA